eukprot:4697696-Heterocapsa_arctica.AAC.1
MYLRLQIGFSSSDFVRNDQRSATNLMAIARMPEDRSKTLKNLQNNIKNLQSHIHLLGVSASAEERGVEGGVRGLG